MPNWSIPSATPENAALLALRLYRLTVTPLKLSLGLQGCCRFTPTCSHYAEQAIAQHGLVTGMKLSAQRLLRCHPWSISGPDPVPASTPLPPQLSTHPL